MSTMSLCRLSVLLSTIAALAACGGADPFLPEHGKQNDDQSPCWGTPGQPGSDGGRGGQINLSFGSLEQGNLGAVGAALHVEGGKGGLPGPHGTPVPFPPAPGIAGAAGVTGRAELHLQPQLAVDLQGIAADDALLVDAGRIYLKEYSLEGPLRVNRLVVAPGQSLKLSGGWIIEAAEILISPGASLVISDRGDRTKNVLGSAVGHQGGDLVLRARRLELHGAIIASGLDGATGERGGNGGRVLIEAERLSLGVDAGIYAAGGAGGSGAAGLSCH